MIFVFSYFKIVALEICTFEEFREKEHYVSHLICSGKQYTGICPNRLKKFPSVTKLTIKETSLDSIPDGIEHLTNLSSLEYTMNNTDNENISFEKLSTLQNLVILKLHYNKFKQIPQTIFLLKNLKVLDISKNLIENVPSQLGNLSSLTSLYLAQNKIVSLPNEITTITTLETLLISDNLIETLPDDFYKLTNLEKLDISKNNLKSITKANLFPKLLKFLNISNNQLKNIATVSNLTELHVFDVSENLLEEIPRDIGCCTKLFVFQAKSNRLTSLPFNFPKLTDLAVLDLADNFFEKIPFEILCLRLLKELSLSGNKLENMIDTDYNQSKTEGGIQYSNSIINFDDNNITLSSYKACRGAQKSIFMLQSLQKLDFSKNNIKKIPNRIKFLYLLRNLNLSSNKIKKIPKKIAFLCNCIINLNGNDIKYIPYNLRHSITFSLVISLVENFIQPKNDYRGMGIEGLMETNVQPRTYQNQYTNYIKTKDVIENLKNEPFYWNVDMLGKITIPTGISDLSNEISDKQMRKIWRKVLKYFVIDEKIEKDSESSDEIDPVVENNLIKITSSDVYKNIKKKAVFNPNTVFNSFSFSSVGNYLRNLNDATFPKEAEKRNIIKKYIKVLFLKLLERIIEANTDQTSIEQIQVVIREISDRFSKCITGQLEGVIYYYSAFFNNNNTHHNPVAGIIHNTIASLKENIFIEVTNGVCSDGIHNISKFRALFKEMLGVVCLFDDPYQDLFVTVNSDYKKGSILEKFFGQFTVERVTNEILNKINLSKETIDQAFELIKSDYRIEILANNKRRQCRGNDNALLQISANEFNKTVLKPNNPDEPYDIDEYKLNMDVISKYFEYTKCADYDELIYTKLKKEGIYKILKKLKF